MNKLGFATLCVVLVGFAACASKPSIDNSAIGAISVYELRHRRAAEPGNILVHGVFQLSIESLMVMDEKCEGNVIGLDIPEAIETKPSVSKFYSSLIKNPTPRSSKAVYATVLVSPQYDTTHSHILQLTLVDVVSQSVSSAAAWQKASADNTKGC